MTTREISEFKTSDGYEFKLQDWYATHFVSWSNEVLPNNNGEYTFGELLEKSKDNYFFRLAFLDYAREVKYPELPPLVINDYNGGNILHHGDVIINSDKEVVFGENDIIRVNGRLNIPNGVIVKSKSYVDCGVINTSKLIMEKLSGMFTTVNADELIMEENTMIYSRISDVVLKAKKLVKTSSSFIYEQKIQAEELIIDGEYVSSNYHEDGLTMIEQ
jgi:hypothetical protein